MYIETLSFLAPVVGAGNLLFGGAGEKQIPRAKTTRGMTVSKEGDGFKRKSRKNNWY